MTGCALWALGLGALFGFMMGMAFAVSALGFPIPRSDEQRRRRLLRLADRLDDRRADELLRGYGGSHAETEAKKLRIEAASLAPIEDAPPASEPGRRGAYR
jgi:hypothetical protein